MTGKKTSLFLQIAKRKGWSLISIGERWGLSERQMTRISNSASNRDIDAVQGLPEYKKNNNINELAMYLGLSDDQLSDLDIKFLADSAPSGNKIHSYSFVVPKDTASHILEITGWKTGQLITSIPTSLIEKQESELHQ